MRGDGMPIHWTGRRPGGVVAGARAGSPWFVASIDWMTSHRFEGCAAGSGGLEMPVFERDLIDSALAGRASECSCGWARACLQ